MLIVRSVWRLREGSSAAGSEPSPSCCVKRSALELDLSLHLRSPELCDLRQVAKPLWLSASSCIK